MGIKMHKLGERCDLFQEGGQVTDPAIDKRMDFHFNAILDVVSEWRKDKSQNQDTPLRGSKTYGSSMPSILWDIWYFIWRHFYLHRKSPGGEEELSSGVWNPVQWAGGESASVSSQQPGVCLWKHTGPGLQIVFCLVRVSSFNVLQVLVDLSVGRYRLDPGTTMSFLPSSQETTRCSHKVTPCYCINWAKVLTSAQTARFVISNRDFYPCDAALCSVPFKVHDLILNSRFKPLITQVMSSRLPPPVGPSGRHRRWKYVDKIIKLLLFSSFILHHVGCVHCSVWWCNIQFLHPSHF